MTRASFLLLLALTTLPAEVRRDTRDPDNLVVHEWGTFTSVAGEHGEQVEWLPLEGQNDLPCFVERFRYFRAKFAIPATVRMETPVLYFYAPRETAVDVSVRFPGGLVTEWYPRAAVTPAATISDGALAAPGFVSTATWSGVAVRPQVGDSFPTEPRASHYYAARRTDAAPVTVGGQSEKFLFYRGVARVILPVSATVSADGTAEVTGRGPLGTIVRFDRRNGRLGFEVRNEKGSRTTIATPALTGDLDTLATRLEAILVGEGLYPREARAMVDTWRDSWFEEGTRLLYLMPRAAVDAMLPLEVKPRPTATERVFVGRMELFTPATTGEVQRALETRDRAALLKYGRFLLPIAQRLLAAPSSGLDRRSTEQFMYSAFADLTRGTACPVPRAQ
jgi:hypothetical protein